MKVPFCGLFLLELGWVGCATQCDAECRPALSSFFSWCVLQRVHPTPSHHLSTPAPKCIVCAAHPPCSPPRLSSALVSKCKQTNKQKPLKPGVWEIIENTGFRELFLSFWNYLLIQNWVNRGRHQLHSTLNTRDRFFNTELIVTWL